MRHFTPEEAHRALVLVRPIVIDILHKKSRLMTLERRLKSVRSRRGDERYAVQLQRTEHDYRKLIEGIEHNCAELEQVGCVLKDTNRGIVDFPSWYKGREVMLCWESGDERIGYWHETTGGIATRNIVNHVFLFAGDPTAHTVWD